MHFFIDHTQLSEQTSAEQKFGPHTETPTTRFNLTTQFQLTSEAKAFACQEGMMVVQKSNLSSDLVNVIIKPSKPVNINGIKVRYYIYRGLKLTDFLSGLPSNYSIPPKNPSTNTEFISFVWENWEIRNNISATTSPTPYNIGYVENGFIFPGSFVIDDSTPVKNIFNGIITPVKAHYVKEGTWIGNFTTSHKIGFEILLESELNPKTTLAICRTSLTYISTEDLSGVNLKRRRELINAYIDPAAFFGMHCEEGVDTTTYTGTTKNKVLKKVSTNTNFYTDLISKFSNKNRVYIDIRSEKGLSYNFYDTYKIGSSNPANLRLNGASVQNAVEYGTNGWPTLYFDTVINENTTRNRVSFRFSMGHLNTNPVLYLQDKRYSKDKETYFYSKTTLAAEFDYVNNSPVWTNQITFLYPHARNTGNNSNIANLIRLFYYRGSPVLGQHDSILRNPKYYDSAFCSLDLEDLGNLNLPDKHIESSSPLYIKESLRTDGTGNFAFATASGAYWNSSKILFYSKALQKEDRSGKKYLRTFNNNLSLSGNIKYNNGLKKEYFFTCKKYVLSGQQELKVLGLNYYQDKTKKPQEKEDLILLGLTITELQLLKNVSGLSSHHSKYIFLEPDFTNFLLDTHNYRYYKYFVRVQGLNTDGTPTIMSPSTDVVVYSRDNQFFSSPDFAASEEYSFGRVYPGDNRIEFRIYNDGNIVINDNIDLSLVRKSVVPTNALSNQGGPIYTLENDNFYPGDTTVTQRIYYYYYDVGINVHNVEPTEICNIDLIMEYKRRATGAVFASGESTASTDQAFSNLGYDLIFNYETYNFTGVDAKKSYRNNNNVIITRGTRKGQMTNLKYEREDVRIYIVYANINEINQSEWINNTLSWYQTVRCFSRIDLFAVFLAAAIGTRNNAIEDNVTVRTFQIGGFAFPDSTSFPSYIHVNGDAFDTNYFIDIGGGENYDFYFIQKLHEYGVGEFLIGPSKLSLRNRAINAGIKAIDGGSLHNGHLHTQKITLNKP